MIDGPAMTSTFGLCFSCSACSKGSEKAKLASPGYAIEITAVAAKG